MEIKSSLLNHKDMEQVKRSLIRISQKDGLENFRVKMLEYINDSSQDANDEFFFDMLEFVRFLDPSDDAVAYTDKNKLVWLNSPGHIGEKIKQWDFIYDHECLHQLWDTFGVAEKLMKNGEEYDHTILNIASDCVINDYLYTIRKKERPDNLITPEYLKENFNIIYDRNNDTQYTLYLKLLEKKEKLLKDERVQDQCGPTIKPKSVEKVDGPDGPPPPPPGKHSEDFKKGWSDAIKDVLDKKVDPLDPKLKPKYTGNEEYDKGYNSAIGQIKDGLENGIQISNSSSNSSGQGSDLQQIPWEMPPQGGSSGVSSSDKNSDKNNSKNDKTNDDNSDSDENSSSNSKNKTANDAQDAADKAKDAADAAEAAADAAEAAADASQNSDNGSSGEMQKNAKKARQAADKARQAANKAQSAADKAKDAADDGDGNGENESAQDAANAATEAAKHAKAAADAAKKNGAKEAADKADQAADDAYEPFGDGDDIGAGSRGAGEGDGAEPIESDVDIEAIRKKAEAVIEKYKNKLSGVFGEFVGKCRLSAKCEKGGLAAESQNAAPGWNKKLNMSIKGYVKNRIAKRSRERQNSYRRPNRRQGIIGSGSVIMPGKRIKDNAFPIKMAFYIDRSGSMGSSINNAFDACYAISEGITKIFKGEKLISDIAFKLHAFDWNVRELQWGKRCQANGGTCPLEELLDYININSKDYLINVIITDAEFGSIDEKKIKDLLKEIDGQIEFVINNEGQSAKKIQQIAKQYPTKLVPIIADSNFTI